jgi:hypothetical protein
MEDPHTHLTLSSIVFVASENTPQAFNRAWLDKNGIFGEEMEIEQAMETPPVKKIQYSNGFVFEAQPERNEIKCAYDVEDTADDKQAKLEDLMGFSLSFARETRHIPYEAVGLNHNIAVESDGLNQLTTGLPDGANVQELVFVLQREEFTVKVELSTATLSTTGAPVVVFSGNFHTELQEYDDIDDRFEEIESIAHEIPNTPTELIEIINDTGL